VPKDGLFLEFVLTLNRTEKLRQIGLPEQFHQAVVALANQLLDAKGEFSGQLEWEAWAAQQLQGQDCLKPYFSTVRGSPVFQISRIAHVLDHLGKPEIRSQYHITSSLAAGWGLHKMVSGAEQVNRFMVFFKTWLIRQGIMEADRRRQSPAISFENSVIVLSAEYKPDTQDARFATGLRKFEILTGACSHLLNALDIEGRMIAVLMHEGVTGVEKRGWLDRLAGKLNIKLDEADQLEKLRNLFPAYQPPAEIRMVSVMGLSTQDLSNYTSDSQLEVIAENTRQQLLALGITSKEIDANLRLWGAGISRWYLRPEIAAQLHSAKLAHLRPGIHALALAVLGAESSYEFAVQGADVIDTGIPHRSLLELLANPSKLCKLMLTGHPNSALVIVDGAAGARNRAMHKHDVMLWFAVGERMGKEAVYLSVGLGQQTVESWRLEMRRKRKRAERLWQALTGLSSEIPGNLYTDIVREINQDQEVYAALAEEDRLKRFGRESRQHRLTESLSRIAQGVAIDELRFADFLALGGIYQFIGADHQDIMDAMPVFYSSLGYAERKPDHDDEQCIAQLFPIDYIAKDGSFRQEKGIESSNKATEERASEALATRRQLAERIAKANALTQRYASYSKVELDDSGFEQRYRLAMQALGDSKQCVQEQAFGAFLAHSRNAMRALLNEFADQFNPDELQSINGRLTQVFSGKEVDEQLYNSIAGGYEDIGDFGRLAQLVRESFQQGGLTKEIQQQGLLHIAQAAELFYIMLAIGNTIALVRDEAVGEDESAIWRALSDFFAKTINDHSYEYRPWVYSRGGGFADLHDEPLYQLAAARHQWLYGYLRFVICRHTRIKALSIAEQDLLLGNFLDGNCIEGIGAGAQWPAEKFWRAYGQLRELAFMVNDGLPVPEVFAEFNPDLIQDTVRVNHVIAAPVGRTHFSRVLCEGPSLARELELQGRRGGNIIISRNFKIVENTQYTKAVVLITSGHFYIDADTFNQALVAHKGYSVAEAELLTAKTAQPKGVRVAANFSRPLQAALVYPFHGHPDYTSGRLEDCGLPYTVQSLFHTWTTYDKTKYLEMFAGNGVDMPDEIAWLANYNLGDTDKSSVLRQIIYGHGDYDYPGLLAFARRHPLVMIKDAAESGGRNAKAFQLGRGDGGCDMPELQQAAEFVYQIARRRNVCIQEVIISSPEHWATEAFMQAFVRRQIIEWGSAVNRQRQPQTNIYGSHRIILSTDNPHETDLHKKWHISHWISLNSKQLITNLGRGGTLEQLLPEYIRPEHQATIIDKLSAAGRKIMEIMSNDQARSRLSYRQETGREIGEDLMGVSYGMPRYMMLDFLIAPVFDRAGVLVDIQAEFDEHGERIGSHFMLQHGDSPAPANIVDWRIVLLEPNVGVGLWDRVALREEYHELQRAAMHGVSPDWQRIGENARIVLRDLNQAGEQYIDALKAKHVRPN
jgi:hypothetical protein